MALLAGALTPREASAQLGALVSPGRLSRAHASLEGISNCLQCHSAGRGVAADKCLTCHRPVAARMAQKKGIHRAVTTDCVSCHVEHAGVDAELRPFNLQRFDHARDTGFPLGGLHAPLGAKCESCHRTRSFLTASPSCASCHADAHKGSLGQDCARCHTAAIRFADSRTKMDHSRTAFPLTGAHGSVACASCHTKGTYKGVAFATCASCHTDPHRTRFGGACASCHTTQSWKTTQIDHSRTPFPLQGAHASVACAACHTRPALQVKPRSDTCSACHTDPHRGVFEQDCGSCHTQSTFRKSAPGGFDHSSTRFPLTERHAELACVSCHTGQPAAAAARPAPRGAPSPPRRGRAAAVRARGAAERSGVADFRGLETACVSCHIDVHRAELGLACENCHDSRSFRTTAFRHARQGPFFEGQHAQVRCAECHAPVYGVSAVASPAAARGRQGNGSTPAPSRGRANSASAASPLLRVGFTQTSETCASCHRDVHLGQVGARCESCHAVSKAKFAVTGFSHATTKFPLTGRHAPLQCAACHTPATQAFPSGHGTAIRLTGIGTDCASCHQDIHRGELGRQCQSCHTADTFAVRRYTHVNARTLRGFFTGRHITACSACHKPAPGQGPAGAAVLASYRIPAACTSCHVDEHRGALGPRCESCHKP